jgi:hypothetical protein
MMTGQRRSLDFAELDEFTPRQKPAAPAAVERKAIDQAAAFPSRERADDSQMNIKAPVATLTRFRKLAKSERYTLGEFLEILMDAYEGRAGRGE